MRRSLAVPLNPSIPAYSTGGASVLGALGTAGPASEDLSV